MAGKLNYHRHLTAKAMAYAITQIQALPRGCQESGDMESMCQHVLEELGETNAARMALDIEARTHRRLDFFPWKGVDEDEDLKAWRASYATEYWKEAASREGMMWGFDPVTGLAMGVDNFKTQREDEILARIVNNLNGGRISPTVG